MIRKGNAFCQHRCAAEKASGEPVVPRRVRVSQSSRGDVDQCVFHAGAPFRIWAIASMPAATKSLEKPGAEVAGVGASAVERVTSGQFDFR